MNLKLEPKNFQGTLNLKYRIKWKVFHGCVQLQLFLQSESGFDLFDVAKGALISESSYKKSLEKALLQAEEKWGIKLTKADLKLVKEASA